MLVLGANRQSGVSGVRTLGLLQEGKQGEEPAVAESLLEVQVSPVQQSNSSKSGTENGSVGWTPARLPQARRGRAALPVWQ